MFQSFRIRISFRMEELTRKCADSHREHGSKNEGLTQTKGGHVVSSTQIFL